MPQIYDMGPPALLPLRRKAFFALKNPTALAGFDPANLGTIGQNASSRPPKPLVSVALITERVKRMCRIIVSYGLYGFTIFFHFIS
jgi:hypothetical protein